MPNNRKKGNKLPDNPVARIRKRLESISGERITQDKFAEMLGGETSNYTGKYVGMLETGRRPVSRKIAEKIIKIAPAGTRIEWVMGEDKFETEADLFNYKCTQARQQSERLGIMEVELLKKIAARAGYKLERKQLTLDEFLHDGEGYIFTDDTGKTTSLGYFGEYGIEALWFDFFDYAAFRLKRTIEKKNNTISWTINYGDEESKKGGTDNGEN